LLVGIRVIEDVVSVTWTSVPGQRYRLQYKTSLQDPEWTDMPAEIEAAGVSSTATDLLDFDHPHFYRIRLAP
jgi:hypothetical protein